MLEMYFGGMMAFWVEATLPGPIKATRYTCADRPVITDIRMNISPQQISQAMVLDTCIAVFAQVGRLAFVSVLTMAPSATSCDEDAGRRVPRHPRQYHARESGLACSGDRL